MILYTDGAEETGKYHVFHVKDTASKVTEERMRNTCLLYTSFVQRIHPKVIMIENVRGLLSRDNGYAIKRIQEILGAVEYLSVSYTHLHLQPLATYSTHAFR